ncbi:MAG: AAA family ATPase [Magnetococcales bacterium]|nr:AAA family ATPase [Magnetococcales bacterium]
MNATTPSMGAPAVSSSEEFRWIKRDADRLFFERLSSGNSCHLLGPPGMGKSALLERTARSLSETSRPCCLVGLPACSPRGATWEGFLAQLAERIQVELSLSGVPDLSGEEETGDPVEIRFLRFLRESLPPASPGIGAFVLLLDDVDALTGALFPPHCLIGLVSHPENYPLTLGLAGSHPGDLLDPSKAATWEKYFQPLEIMPISLREVGSLSPRFDGRKEAAGLVREVYLWCGGNPGLCLNVLARLSGPDSIERNDISKLVQEALNEAFRARPPHMISEFMHGEKLLLRNTLGLPAQSTLLVYRRLLEEKRILLSPEEGETTLRTARLLRMAGLAVQVDDRQEIDMVLEPASRLFLEYFDLRWVLGQLGIYHNPPGEEPSSGEACEGPWEGELLPALPDLVRYLNNDLLGARGKIPHWRLPEGEQGREIIDGLLFHFTVEHLPTGEASPPYKTALMQLYMGLEGVGNTLWENEIRALTHLSSLNHNAIPTIHHGGTDRESEYQVAYVISRSHPNHLGMPGELLAMSETPEHCLFFFDQLVDGLAAMHRLNLVHRNIWPGSIGLLESSEEGPKSPVFMRFEMSSLISNLLLCQETRVDQKETERAINQAFKRQGTEAHAYAAPERLSALFFPEQHQEIGVAGTRSDIFSLGMIGFRLFVGDFPRELLQRAFPNGGFDPEAHREFLQEVRYLLQSPHNGVYPRLRDLLARMLEFKSADRPHTSEVEEFFVRNWNNLNVSREEFQQREHLLVFFPDLIRTTLRNLGYESIISDPLEATETLCREVAKDLDQGILIHSPQGFVPYNTDADIEMAELSQWVLLGKRLAYFTDWYRQKDSRGRRLGPPRFEEMLLLRFSVHREKVALLELTRRKRQLPPVVLREKDDLPDHDQAAILAYPSWKSLTNSVKRSPQQQEFWHFIQAQQWLLELEKVRMDAAIYPVEVLTRANGGGTLKYLADLDLKRFIRSPLLLQYCTGSGKSMRRLEMGYYFLKEAEQDSNITLTLVDESGRRIQGEHSQIHGRFIGLVRALDPGEIRVKWDEPQRAPYQKTRGYLASHSQRGDRVQFARHQEAFGRLIRMPHLVSQLTIPRIHVRRNLSWPKAGEGLKGNAPEIIRHILNTQPFFALQGPPGTGKTTVIAHAVGESLRADPGLRILVTAQSHYALDNLGRSIIGRLKKINLLDDVTILRVAPSRHQTQESDMKDYFPETLVTKRLRDMKNCQKEPCLEGSNPEVSEALGRLATRLDQSSEDLHRFFLRGANLVLATTNSLTEFNLGQGLDQTAFDWVIVEEAAKAWPTELAMALTLGNRWTLVGDDRQLPPFSAHEVERFLEECAESKLEELRGFGKNRKAILTNLKTLEGMFSPSVRGEDPRSTPYREPATGRLSLQFRMVQPLGDLVSTMFYDRSLKTYKDADQKSHDLQEPDWLKDRPLVWLDTTDLGDEAREDQYERVNQQEMELIKKLLHEANPPRGKSLAILSPYRSQCNSLTTFLDTNFQANVFTVDAFQGREADIVIVSLVRNQPGLSETVPLISRLGFLEDRNRLNVLLSRARQLLVIVGAFEYFQKSAESKLWSGLCAEFHNQGGVVVTSRKWLRRSQGGRDGS